MRIANIDLAVIRGGSCLIIFFLWILQSISCSCELRAYSFWNTIFT